MSYSCTDFTDDILNSLNIEVPDEAQDSPSDQADLAMAEIDRLQEGEKAFAAALGAFVAMPDDADRAADQMTGMRISFAELRQVKAALAGVPVLSAAEAAGVSPGIDWRTIAQDLAGALSSCTHQIGQMEDMFDDDDGTIAEAVSDAEAAQAVYRAAGKVAPATPAPEVDHWAERAGYLIADWQQEVTNGDTRLGYHAWVDAKAEADTPASV